MKHGVVPNNQRQKDKRVYYLDVLRVLACLAVIMIHTSATYVVKDIGSLNFWIGNCFDSVSRFAVPVFVMVSGALFLNEDYTLTSQKLKSHIVKMITFFCFWSATYCLFFSVLYPFLKHEQISIIQILYSFIKGHYHLWFIYMIVGLYLILPLLRLWVKKEYKRYVEYFIVLALVFTYFLPQIVDVGGAFVPAFKEVGKNFIYTINLKFVGGYTTYFILGWYISTFDFNIRSVYLRLAWFCATLFTIVMSFVLSRVANEPIQMYSNLSINVLIQSLSIFCLIKARYDIDTNESDHISDIVHYVSSRSLGVYAIHAGLVSVFNKAIEHFFDSAFINIPLMFIFTLVLSLLLVSLIRRIPIIKRFV